MSGIESNNKLTRVMTGHADQIEDCAYAPDGLSIVSASRDGTLRIWSAATGICQRVLNAQSTFAVLSCAYAPDSRSIISGSEDGTLRLWDADTGDCLRVYKGEGRALSCAFSPDGKSFVSGHDMQGHNMQGHDMQARIWDVSGQCRHFLKGHDGPVMRCGYSPDGRTIATAGWRDGSVRLWDAQSGVCQHVLAHEFEQPERLSTFAFAPDSRSIATATAHNVQTWDVATGNCLHRIVDNESMHSSGFEFSPDLRSVVVSTWGNGNGNGPYLRILDANSGVCLRVLDGKEESHYSYPVKSCAFSPDARTIVTSADARLSIWDVSNTPQDLLDVDANLSQRAPHMLWLLKECAEALSKLKTDIQHHNYPGLSNAIDLDLLNTVAEVTRPFARFEDTAREQITGPVLFTTKNSEFFGDDDVDDDDNSPGM